MNLYRIRDNNCIQPNRMFALRGKVVYVEKEVDFSVVKLLVYNYQDIDGKQDDFIIYFRKDTKKIIDAMVIAGLYVSVMGDMIKKGSEIFLEGKTVEIFKDCPMVKEVQSQLTDPQFTNYDRAF